MKKRSFRSTFVSVILVITVAIFIVNLVVYGINIKEIRQAEVLKMKTAGEQIDDMITISLNNIKGLKQICYTDNYARNILLENNEKNDISTKFENQNYMDNALKHIASMDTLILRATIVNEYGNIYCTDTSIPEEYVKTIRNMTKEWMLFEGKEDEYYYGGLQEDNANILTFLYPLYTYGNTPIALLAVDINYKTFQTILENSFYENSGDCFILTGEQELFHVGENLYEKEEKGYIFDKGKEMMKENLIVDTFQSKEKTFYISSRQNMLSGWKIIQIIPEEKMFEEINQKIKWNTIFLLGALVLVVSFSIYYTKKIIEPLEEFCKKISHTREDQLQIINLEHMKLTKEIANVIENYNGMANRMNEYLVREIIYEKNQRKIQSKMLRYQINPHFLYNTLNLIASMGELSDFPEIVEITKNLSCIMQYNVKGSRFVSLKTEVEMVKAYLEIQRIRFHDCFSVEYEIEKQIEEIKIVKFILQPIVENIFEHGFAMDENENKIWIKAFKSEDNIVILVKDVGFRKEATKIPLMIGSVFGEFYMKPQTFFKDEISKEELMKRIGARFGDWGEELAEVFQETYPEKNLADLLTLDTVFRCPTKKFIKEFAKSGGKIYSYLFTLEFPYQHGKTAWHCSDIPFVFHNTELVPVTNIPEISDKLEKQMFDAVIHFAETGNPNHSGIPQWPVSTEEREATMIFDRVCTVRFNFDDYLLELHKKALPNLTLANIEQEDDQIQH